MNMAYGLPKETFLLAGRDKNGELVLRGERSKKHWVSNPSKGDRRKKTERIELPLAKYDDLRIRVGLVRSKSAGKYPPVKVGGSEDIYTLMAPLSNEPQEVFSAVLLDAQNVVLGVAELHRGGLTTAAVDPRVVFTPALLSTAVSIIFVHNHPSGNPEPSVADQTLTSHLSKAADIFGIAVLDHVIIGTESYTSFADRGLL
jgi:hypothetical protein